MKKLSVILTAALSIILLNLFSSCQYYSYGLDEFLYRTNTLENRTEKLLNLSSEASFSSSIPEIPRDKAFTILVITDVHFGGENQGKNPDRWEKEFFEKLESLYPEKSDSPEKPLFCVCLGDTAEHGLEDEFSDFNEKICTKLKNEYNIQTFNVVGNHDLYNSGYSEYKKYCFPYTSFYYFTSGGISFYFLDSASCSLGNRQFTKLQRRFSYDDNKKLVFMHVPLYADDTFYFSMQNTDERNRIISLFAKNDVTAVIDGHTHKKATTDLGKFTEYNLPGYLEDQSWTIFTVEPETAQVKCQTSYLK